VPLPGPTGPGVPLSDVIARFVSFLVAIEWFLICEPRIMPLAQAAPPPSATNNASAAMTVAGCRSCLPIRASSCTTSVDPLVDYPVNDRGRGGHDFGMAEV